jgi:hypothetical protein
VAGRFPILTDACVNDHLAQALEQRGWDVKRAVDLYPEKTKDEVLALAVPRGFSTRAGELALEPVLHPDVVPIH